MRNGAAVWFCGAGALVGVLPHPQTPASRATTQNTDELITPDSAPTFSAGVNLVLVPVVVRDKKGRAIGTLRKEDFQLFDKGKRQVISKFSLERAGDQQIVPSAAVE